MAGIRSLVDLSSKAALFLLLITVATQTQMAKAQSCSAELNNLNVCAPFVVPGSSTTNPSQECCNALRAVDHECICSTVRIAVRLPSQCNMPPLTCSTNNGL